MVHGVCWRPVIPAQGDTGVYLIRLLPCISLEFMDKRMDNISTVVLLWNPTSLIQPNVILMSPPRVFDNGRFDFGVALLGKEKRRAIIFQKPLHSKRETANRSLI